MNNELGRLESALRATSPRPPEPARERALAAAMAEFDRRHQGTPGEARRKGQVPNRGTSWIRRLVMPMSRPSLAVAGVAGFVLLAGVVLHLTSVAPPLSPELALAPAGVDDSLDGAVTATEATKGSSAPAEGAAIRARAAERSLARSAEAGREPKFDFYRLLPGQPRRDAATGEAEHRDRLKLLGPPGTESLVVAEAPPGSAESAVEGRESYALMAADSETTPADYRDQGRDQFADFDAKPVKVVADEPVSTFSIDVDTASYGFVRASLNNGVLPQVDAVRVEELVNYFPYDYPGPESREAPFRANVSLMPAPWNAAARFMHIGIRSYALAPDTAPRANLVFLVDTSGSMGRAEQAPPRRQLPQAAARHPRPRGHGGDRGLRGRSRHRAPTDPGGRAGADPRRPRTP